jgi:catechol 2,3-dioxygenase-like lactoylglutathione lyase family enzyme
VITAVHTLVYADDADAARAFFRDVLGWAHVDAHDGWLIFRTGPSELGVHPTGDGPRHHEISLMCDDIERTIVELTAKGAVFNGEIQATSFGRTVMLAVPGAGELLVYEARHPTAYDLSSL